MRLRARRKGGRKGEDIRMRSGTVALGAVRKKGGERCREQPDSSEQVVKHKQSVLMPPSGSIDQRSRHSARQSKAQGPSTHQV